MLDPHELFIKLVRLMPYCVCIGLLGRHNSLTSQEIIASDVMSAMVTLIASLRHKRQLAGLGVISGLALSSESAARKLLSPVVLSCLQV